MLKKVINKLRTDFQRNKTAGLIDTGQISEKALLDNIKFKLELLDILIVEKTNK